MVREGNSSFDRGSRDGASGETRDDEGDDSSTVDLAGVDGRVVAERSPGDVFDGYEADAPEDLVASAGTPERRERPDMEEFLVGFGEDDPEGTASSGDPTGDHDDPEPADGGTPLSDLSDVDLAPGTAAGAESPAPGRGDPPTDAGDEGTPDAGLVEEYAGGLDRPDDVGDLDVERDVEGVFEGFDEDTPEDVLRSGTR